MKTILVLSLAALAAFPSCLAGAEVSLQSAAPVVVKTFPVAGSTNVDPALTELRITYSKPMSERTWEWFNYENSSYPQMLGDPKYSDDKRTLVRAMKLEPGKFYGIWLNRHDSTRGIVDANGIPAVPYLLTFATAAVVSNQPSIAGAFPGSTPATWLKEGGIDLDKVDPRIAPLTQVMSEDLQPDGTSRFRSVIRTVNRSSESQTMLQFMNSDIVELQRILDADGNAIPFTTVHRDRTFRYSATLPNPIPPGGTLIYGSEGTVRDKVIQDAGLGTFTYRFTHSPGSGVTTRRVEIHRLPPGAELIELTSNATQREAQGRTEVVLDELVKPRGNVTIEYRYRLPGTKQIVQTAVTTISHCAEGDPRVEAALKSLQPLDQSQVLAALVPQLDATKDTIRRSAIYILWKAGFADITAAAAPLQRLLAHKEDLTRGMAALALGQNRMADVFEPLAKMIQDDPSGYARRCAAYALGLLGDGRAQPILKTALNDSESMVRENAKAALVLLGTSKAGEPTRDESGQRDMRTVITEKIRTEVERELKEAGATFDNLRVTVAVKRDSGTPFKVTYQGLRNFKSSDGKVLNQPDGEFVMEYIGGGQWQGRLAGVIFSAQVGSVDNIELPFVNDPQVLGEWESVDFVGDPSQFNPDKRASSGELFLKGMTFLDNGKFPQRWLTWTKGVVMHQGDKTASSYEIQEINGRPYLFFEWKSGDVTIGGRKPHYYVLTKKTSTDSSSAEAEVKTIARQFAAAIRQRDHRALKALSCNSAVDGWIEAVPHFADELRTHLSEFGVGFDPLDRIEEVLVEGDVAAVKTANLPEKKAYLALFFQKTPEGWRNSMLRNSPASKPLREHLNERGAHMDSVRKSPRSGDSADAVLLQRLNGDQRAVLEWTDRQFRSFFDARTFDGWSADERASLEKRSIDGLSGPRSTEYYQAINTLAALRSTNALPRLRDLAFDRREKDDRDRWMAVRALGMIGDQSAVPELIHLVYYGNVNTHWWAQLSLVRLTGQNFGNDWKAWGDWWNKQNGQPPFHPEIIRWWSGQPESDNLAASLEESDRKFLEKLRTPNPPK